MQMVWWIVFLLSASCLIVLVLRNKAAAVWLASMGVHVVAAAVLLYLVNWVGQSFDFRIPVNGPSLVTIGVLGIPGLLFLAAVKLTLVG